MKNTNGKIIIIICALFLLALSGCNNETPDNDNGYEWNIQVTIPTTGVEITPPEPNVPASPTLLVSYELILGDILLTVPEYNFHFIEFMYEAFERYWHQFGFDPFDLDLPLEEQIYLDGEQTWANYIHSLIDEVIKQYAQARENGLQLTEDDIASLVEYELELLHFAVSRGFATTDELIASFYVDMTTELFMQFAQRDILINRWRADVMNSISFTIEEMEEFYYDNWIEIDPMNNGVRDTTVLSMDARHILAMLPNHPLPSSAEEIAATRQIAEDIFAEWQNGEATEESFASLARERTDDPGSAATGGLYSNIWPGQMVPEFDEWIFDPSRNFGDTDIVETDFGFHIMFFVRSNEDWKLRTESAMIARAVQEIISEVESRFTIERRPV